MLDTTKKPNIHQIEDKARLLYRLAHTAALRARDTNYDTPKETIDEFSEFIELLDNAAHELYIMISVSSGFSRFDDFAECASIWGKKPKAQDGESK